MVEKRCYIEKGGHVNERAYIERGVVVNEGDLAEK